MRKLIEKIYGSNRSWWDNFTSCFIGSLLGIGITFAISGYLEYRNNKELEHTIQLMNVAYMDLIVSDFKEKEESVLYLDSLFRESLRYCPDSIYSIPPGCLQDVYKELLLITVSGKNNSIENIVNNSLELWTSAENLSIVTDINEFYADKKAADNCIKEITSIREKLYDNITKKYSVDLNNYKEAVSHLYGNEENLCLMRRYRTYVQALPRFIPMMEEMLVYIKENMRISDEELDDLIYRYVDEEDDESSSTDSKSE